MAKELTVAVHRPDLPLKVPLADVILTRDAIYPDNLGAHWTVTNEAGEDLGSLYHHTWTPTTTSGRMHKRYGTPPRTAWNATQPDGKASEPHCRTRNDALAFLVL